MAPLISVIIVNYNSGSKLRKSLEHLQTQTFTDFEVIVIDNASEDGSADCAGGLTLDIRLIRAGSNLGFAAGNNQAAQQARGKWLALLNPDAYARPDWLAEFVSALERYPQVAAFGSTQIDANRPDKLDGGGDVFNIMGIPYRGYFGWDVAYRPPEGETFAACGASAFYRADIFAQLGGFDERFFCYCEDVDLGFRLRLSGQVTIQLEKAIVDHEGSAITGRHSDFTTYYGHRNRIWTAYKSTPFWLYWPFLPLHFMANLYLLVRSPRLGLTRPYVKALIAGYGGLGQFRAERRALLAARKASTRSIARAISWSPTKLLMRQGRVWPYDKAARIDEHDEDKLS